MELFWVINQEARVALENYQYDHHKDEKPLLDMAKEKAPWEIKPPIPEIPTEEMTEQDIQREMESNSEVRFKW